MDPTELSSLYRQALKVKDEAARTSRSGASASSTSRWGGWTRAPTRSPLGFKFSNVIATLLKSPAVDTLERAFLPGSRPVRMTFG